MANATSKLSILIDAKNNASSALKQVASDAAGLESALGKIGKGLAVGLGVATVSQIAETGYEMARAAAEAGRLGVAFDNLAGQAGEAGDEMLAAMREASHGTISDTELMLAANKAMMLGVADSAAEMSQLLEIAGARGKAMGLSTAQAFSDLVTGLGRQSALILDNLGITVDAEAANEAYAESLGRSASSLSEAEKKQALLNAVIQDSTAIVNANKAAGDDAASNFERMDAAISNAKVALGELFSPAVAAIAQMLADTVNTTVDAMQEMGQSDAIAKALDPDLLQIELLNEQIDNLKASMADLAKQGQIGSDAYRQQGAEVDRLTAKVTGLSTAVAIESSNAGAADDATRGLSGAMGTAEQAAAAMAARLYTTNRALAESALMANLAQEAFSALRAEQEMTSNSIEQAAAGLGAMIAKEVGGAQGIAKQQAITTELKSQVEAWKDQGYTQEQINDVLLPGMVAQMNEAERAVFSTAKGTSQISDAAREAERAFSDLESKVAGVLQGALDVGVGVDPDDVLASMGFPREDAINENARRLADIAKNGLKNQEWLSEFQNEVPDIWQMIRTAQNPQEEAARLLKDFQDGLLTSPIDKEKAKEIVKRQIMGDQNMAALANEIAQELAVEMGIPLQQALAATSGALGTGGGAGSEAATTFSDAATAGLEDSGGGGVFVDKFIEQMRNRYSLLQTAGRDAGKQWGASFLEVVGENVPTALIEMLANLVTPQVFAKFAQQGTLQGSAP